MSKRHFPFIVSIAALFCALLWAPPVWMAAQEQGSSPENPVIHKVVEMVQLNVAVTDKKGDYVTGLRPSDFSIAEDRIAQKVATFEEGQEAPRQLDEPPPGAQLPRPAEISSSDIPGNVPSDAPGNLANSASGPGGAMTVAAAGSGASVFILFDTSNYMYRRRGFVFAQDAIAEFVRSLQGADRVAFYSYSRDLSREAALTADRAQVLRGVRATVNGDDSALYNALLLTLKDAGRYTGRKAVVVFSNGPDNSSMVPPEDVGELAQSEGVAIYIVSTQDAKLDAVTAAVFERMSANTGGEAYFAKDWKEQQKAFTSIRDDLAHLYLLSYYPQPNPNRGWRAITVKLVGEHEKQYHVRTRQGYRPLPERVSEDSLADSNNDGAVKAAQP